MCSSWRCGAPIRCHYTRCLRMPLAGGEGSCAQNQPRYSHSPYRSRAENIIRFERLGAVITSSHRDREKVLLFGSFYLEVAFVIVSLRARTGLIFFFYFFFSSSVFALFSWSCGISHVVVGLSVKKGQPVLCTGNVGYASWLQPAIFALTPKLAARCRID